MGRKDVKMDILRRVTKEGNVVGVELDMDGYICPFPTKGLYNEQILVALIDAGYKFYNYQGDIDLPSGKNIDSLEAKDSVGTIVDISYLTADVEVAETDVSKLKIGQQVELKFPSYDGIVMGKVIGWPAIGEVTSRGATVVKVKIQIDEYPASILPNFSFSGKIKISPDEDILLVERYAVGRENKKAFVVKATGEKIDVEVVPYSSEYVKIVSGDVREGDVLLQQTTPKVSGTRRNMGPKNGMSGAPAMGGRK